MKRYTMKDVITLLGITKNTLINWEKSGKMPPAKRESLSGYRYWTEEELEMMRELSKEVKGRVFMTYRGQKLYAFCPKEGHWKYQILYFDYGKTEIKSKMITPRGDFTTKEEALENAKKIIDNIVRKNKI